MEATAVRTGSRPGFLDRTLARVGGDESEVMSAKLMWFRRYVFLHLAVESWFRYSTVLPNRMTDLAFALVLTMCAAFGVFDRWARSASEILAVTVLAQIAWSFPHTANHIYVMGVIVIFLAMFDPRNAEESGLLMKGLRWIPLIVLFYSGFKKLLYGYWFDAAFFGQMIGVDPRFKEFFRPLLAPEEHLRLVRQFWPGDLGFGPYGVRSPLVVTLSNLVWILEVLLPIGFLIPRLRRVAMVVSIAMLFVFALATRELFVGVLGTSLVLLYAGRDLNRRLFPVFVLFLLWVVLVTVGVIPRWGLS